MSRGPSCTECSREVVGGQGTRHISCSPICTRCSQPITSRQAAQRGTMHDNCPIPPRKETQ